MSNGHCGYCGKSGSNSWFITSKGMRCSEYESLMVRGWRRCGEDYYCPQNKSTCCPMYPIRLDPDAFRPSASQKRVLRRARRLEREEIDLSLVESKKIPSVDSTPVAGKAKQALAAKKPAAGEAPRVVDAAGETASRALGVALKAFLSAHSLEATLMDRLSLKAPSTGLDEQQVAEEVASALQTTLGYTVEASNGFLNFATPTPTKPSPAVAPPSPDDSTAKTRHPPPGEASSPPAPPPLTKHTLEMRLMSSEATKEKYLIYREYQNAVHKDYGTSMMGFESFLCGTPLVVDAGHEKEVWGTQHMGYFLDGKLIGFSTLDFLPHYVSSVYFCYDPKYKWLDLGTYSALREIEYCRALPHHPFYCMGFFIPNCPKMRYKGYYHPSEVLCLHDWRFYPLESVLPRMEATGYRETDFSEDSEKSREIRRRLTDALVLRFRGSQYEKLMTEFFTHAGPFSIDRFELRSCR